MDETYDLCELLRLKDLERLSSVVDALEAKGIDTDVRDESGGVPPGVHAGSRLMVRCTDLVYARWIAYAAGFDPWPERRADDG